MTGTIARLSERGFGFIEADDARGRFFFHASCVADSVFEDLQEGQAVSFELNPEESAPDKDHRPRATQVKTIPVATPTAQEA